MGAIKQVGLKVATDETGSSCEKMIPFLIEPVLVHRNDSFIAAFPSPKAQIIYGIDFPQVNFLCIASSDYLQHRVQKWENFVVFLPCSYHVIAHM